MTQELPSYLGFGTLATNSVSTQAGKTSADYLCGDEVVYRIIISSANCQIIEFFEGERIGITVDSTLEKAFCRHMMSLLPYENRRFEKTYHKICDGRNIYVRFPEQPHFIYFPAGYIFALRQPIVKSNRQAVKALKARLKCEEDVSLIKFEGERSAVIFRLMQSGEVRGEEVSVVDFSAMLLNLTSATDWLWQSKIVPPEKEYRLTVIDSSEAAPGNFPIYVGDPDRGFVTFSVFITDGIETPLGKLAEQFYDLAMRFVDMLQKRRAA